MSKTINELVREAHENAIAKGWWEEPRSFGELIALCHSELSETLEDYRAGHKPDQMWYELKGAIGALSANEQVTPEWKPCGIPSELADVVIRIFDMCGRYGIDLERAIAEKMAYNATRPHRHGGKVL
jgi:NTP pyrophosphatase (non-canonical NTP hydrolase)